MLQKVMRNLKGDTIVARDGEIGSLEDVFFDDERWAVRYLVVDTGRWLPGRRVLISPASVERAPTEDDAIAVKLTREQVQHAPDTSEHPPASRLYEEAHARYYGYGPYWAGPYLWGAAGVPVAVPPAETVPLPREAEEAQEQARERAERSHLRSSAEVVGYHIRAADGELGHVEDFLVDDRTWAIADMVVDTRNWLPGKKVLVPPSAIAGIDWDRREVTVKLSRAELKEAPRAA